MPDSTASRLAAWIAGLRPRSRLILSGLLGALTALGQAPWGLWPLTILGLALLYAILRISAPGWKSAFMTGLAGGAGYFALSLNWIVEPFLVDVARHGWMAPFALIGLSVGLALFWGVAFALARFAGGRAPAFVAALVLAEAARTYLLTGFPWAQTGHALISTPFLHWASIGGSLLLSALVAGAATALWHMLSGPRLPAALTLAIFAALHGAGLLLTPAPGTDASAPLVRIIQPNAPQHEKWDPEKIPVFFARQIDFTAAPPETPGASPSLIVWPETAVPVLLDRAGPTLDAIADAADGVPVVLGMQRIDGQRFYNSLVVLDASGQVGALYDKHHLVPFGEYIPFGDTLQRFGITAFAAQAGNGYSPGPGARLVDLGDLGQALPLICYEGVFPQDVRAAPKRPDMLLLITNDAWFGQVSGPYQHLAQARLRSAEQGLPMIRVANTGVSAMIDPAGRVLDSIPLGQAGWRDVRLPPPLAPTIYARLGDAPVLALATLLLVLSFLQHRRSARPI
ncbi:MAG: apolipoprotein N-acyltransferase [Roseovarius sp.]|nr:apolipoprotein N-acyltransferase [Roseovarius sp.]